MGMGLCLPLTLLIWFVRRCFYVLQQPQWAAVVSLVYSVLLIGGSFFLHTYRIENTFFWWGIYGLSSLTGLIIFARIPEMRRKVFVSPDFEWKRMVSDQWDYGRWIVLAAFLNFSASQIQIFVVASFLGLESAGVFRAIQNFMLPMFQILAAVSTLALPSITFEFGLGNYQVMKRKSLQITLLLVGLALGYELVLFLFGADLEVLLYGGRYSNHVWLIPWIGLVPLISAMETGYSLILRSLQKPVFYIIDKAVAALVVD